MKVIKDGKLAKQVTCKYCECIYEYNGKDVKIEYDYCSSILQSSCYKNTEKNMLNAHNGEKNII